MASILSNLTWTVTDAVTAQASGMIINTIESAFAGGKKDHLRFYYQYEAGGSIINILAKSAFGAAASELSNVAIEQYKKFIGLQKKKQIVESASAKARSTIINAHHVNEQEKYGRIVVNKNKVAVSGARKNAVSVPASGDQLSINNNNAVLAYDIYGNICTDALMLAIPLKTPITVTQRVFNADSPMSGGWTTMSFQSDTLVWYDTVALVSIDSSKNLILTRVQGRDYSRKELISNGDISFTVSGTICSNYPDVYPEEEVQKFIQVMQYKGVVEVNNQVLDQFGISKIVIKDFSLSPREGYKSTQQYSFSAVGIQPDKETMVKEDTITIINQAMVETEEEKSPWSKMLEDKVDGLKRSSVDIASQGLALATGILDNAISDW